MLHEILLSLSGHSSPLFDPITSEPATTFDSISPPELALLKKIGRLATLNRLIQTQSHLINANHDSPICKSVATTIVGTFLEKFRSKVVEVEKSILQKDSSIVGAYNIVPLATIVGEFEEWPRLLDWLYQLTIFILPSESSRKPCNGAKLINKLREDSQTGYPDIHDAAIHLSKVAELTWMKQLSGWLLFGKLPLQTSDFVVASILDKETKETHFELVPSNFTTFLSTSTASSILFIGKSLTQVFNRYDPMSTTFSGKNPICDAALILDHQKIIANVSFPISNGSLTESINEIRQSLSKRVLHEILPLEKILQLITTLKEFFLLGHGEFAISIIKEADSRLMSRTKSSTEMLIKSGEISSIMRKTWTTLISFSTNDDQFLDLIEYAREIIHLYPGKALDDKPKEKLITFNDFLLPNSTHLGLTIKSPFDLFITSSEIKVYSDLNMYLISIRRGNLHLSDLWKLSGLRKDHPTPKDSASVGIQTVVSQRTRRLKRFVEMRKIWATCSAALFLLSELGEFFEGHVIPSMWLSLWNKINSKDDSNDPESLANQHIAFLDNLTRALLYQDQTFTARLKEFLQSIDDLIAQITRLQRIQNNLDLEEDEGIFDALANNQKDLEDCNLELDRSRKRVDSGSRSVVGRLRELAAEGNVADYNHGPKIENLLMKLDFGQIKDQNRIVDVSD